MVETVATKQRNDPPAWWPDVEHVVVMLEGVRGRTADGELLIYEPGDAYPAEADVSPPVTGESWANSEWQSTKLCALDGDFERLDAPAFAERHSDDVDTESILARYRSAGGAGYTVATRNVFVCADCGREFETKDALNGHRQVHRDDPDDTDDDARSGDESGVETSTGDELLASDDAGDDADESAREGGAA